MKVSIITPSYNQGKFIGSTIKSVIDQNYSDIEHIVIDGGSTDNTIEILKKYEHNLAYWVSEKDNGQSQAFNKGFYKSTGEIIGWINSDDIYYNDAVKRAVAIFENNPDIDIVFSNYHYIDSDDNIIHTKKEIPFDFKMSFYTGKIYVANVAGFFRRRVFEKYGVLREDLQFGMDIELYLRFAYNKCKFQHVNEFWGGYRLHDLSKSISASDKQISDANIIFNEYKEKINPTKFQLYFLPFFYKYYRYLKKLLNGCYSFSNISSSRIFTKSVI